MVWSNHLPDFDLSYDPDKDQVTFYSKKKYLIAHSKEDNKTLPPLPSWVYEKAKKIAPMMDVYALEEDWRLYWSDTGKQEIDNPSAAFLGFCKKAYREQKAFSIPLK